MAIAATLLFGRYQAGLRYNSSSGKVRNLKIARQLDEAMPDPAERETSDSQQLPHVPKFLPILAETWIFFTIFAFLVIRIWGSNAFKHFMHSVGH